VEGAPWIALLAVTVVGVAAFLLGLRAGRRQSPSLPQDYYRGLDHLLNDRLDRAVESFARLAAQDGDAIEIQWALGALFRRRGEFDRAIALHERLAADAAVPALRERARMELAQDYLAAGLMDRAARLLHELAASSAQHAAATLKLMQLHETERDWSEALRAYDDLPAPLRAERGNQAAQYLCELTEQALVEGDVARVNALLQQALRHDSRCARAAFLRARVAERDGAYDAAVAHYIDAIAALPDLLVEVSRRLHQWPAASAAVALRQLRSALESRGGLSPRQLDLCLGATAARAGDEVGAYRCSHCGMPSARWFWRCPGCRSWSTLVLAALGPRRPRPQSIAR
jgi:lipopolysaccharide biosynthesis regulator YciM